MTTRERVIRIIGAIILFGLALIMFSSCSKKTLCPTYSSAIRAKKQASFEKRGGNLYACYYKEDITKKEKKRSSKIWNSDFCEVKKKKWKR